MENGSVVVVYRLTYNYIVRGRKTEVALQGLTLISITYLEQFNIDCCYKLHLFRFELSGIACTFERKLKVVIQQQSDDHNPLFSRLDAL